MQWPPRLPRLTQIPLPLIHRLHSRGQHPLHSPCCCGRSLSKAHPGQQQARGALLLLMWPPPPQHRQQLAKIPPSPECPLHRRSCRSGPAGSLLQASPTIRTRHAVLAAPFLPLPAVGMPHSLQPLANSQMAAPTVRQLVLAAHVRVLACIVTLAAQLLAALHPQTTHRLQAGALASGMARPSLQQQLPAPSRRMPRAWQPAVLPHVPGEARQQQFSRAEGVVPCPATAQGAAAPPPGISAHPVHRLRLARTSASTKWPRRWPRSRPRTRTRA